MRSILSLFTVGLVALPLAAQETSLLGAMQSGKASVLLRTRFEQVQDDVTGRSADALTNRFTLSYKTLGWKGFSAFAEFENIASLAEPRYFVPQTGYGRPGSAVVVDPPLSQLNQFYVEGYGLKVGRQVLNFGNQRFIGSVGWRQNDQTFTGATYTNQTLVPKLAFTLGYLTQVQAITGATRDINANLLEANIMVIPDGNIRLYYYAFDEKTAPATSLAHTGVRVDGKAWRFLYDVALARQKPYLDATVTSTPEADYRYLGLGFQITKDITVTAAQETLEKGFRTPYATLHAWNGWVDRFLATPANGLVDTLARLQAKVNDFQFEAVFHEFKADTGSAKYGTELDASVTYKATSWLSLLVKAGDYKGDSSAPGALARNQRKVWLQSIVKF